ncbi:MAG: hypothetical protein IKE65_06665 [Clostridia bacterium]|nr:hypothetical protein [Clostridia bacterium]
MKRLIVITLALALLCGFSACSKNKDATTTSESASTTAAATQEQTTTEKQTTAKTTKSTTAKKADISAIYSGYWYKNEGNKVLVLKFEKSGSVTVSTYRRKTIASDTNEPDSVLYGSFKDKGNGTLSVCYDNENPEESDLYTLQENGVLSCKADDPEGEKTVRLVHFDKLDKDTARQVLLGEN